MRRLGIMAALLAVACSTEPKDLSPRVLATPKPSPSVQIRYVVPHDCSTLIFFLNATTGAERPRQLVLSERWQLTRDTLFHNCFEGGA